MLDANWYGDEFNESSNPMTPKGGADIPNLIQYAADRDVKIILYFNHAATKNFDFDETLATYAGWGAAGLKYGFLKGYEATLYEDAPDAHYKTNREAYQVRTRTVRKGDTIRARMVPGGGHAIRLRPKK